ncbi:hypothetical protein CANTEDRAFT_129526 [Yamadazyma tenuis ATCC 10573]|uniref:PHD-type domain-containing protein n=1 Tax=Candida tenuis (strain ATCC 10573 / BCRC 21748 / CBS 615 / JCM 9827 / NBRC 10315 / NRRL Y-1498 / VKM Y-70) TaxID=590646 RepID=G3AZS8_CANTC|nr:uncharacterized protein CANTEDRAFT_129526 [Yamadazyma tenuis ATCC 10573]EGV65230.1 hypothetical protein CANTEDRAFT_129526 [Yamadazyma tenuis ATCC 10573]
MSAHGPITYSSINHHPVEIESSEELTKQYKKFKSAPKFDFNSDELYCICRKPDVEGQLMVGCDGCDEWFHFKCVGINTLYKELIATFFCKFCQWKGKGNTKWKRKCRVDTCWKSVDTNSKYCSKECGIEYMKQLKENVAADKIKLIVDQFGLDQFKELGLEFPELDQVKQFEQNLDKFPEDLRIELAKSEKQLSITKKEIEEYKKKIELLTRYKELMKTLNEKVTKFSTKKKVELCLYNRNLRKISQPWVEDFQASINDIADSYKAGETTFKDTCIQEKRKCPRHNGSMNLINDEFIVKIGALEGDLKQFQEQQTLVLRDYSISVYERS